MASRLKVWIGARGAAAGLAAAAILVPALAPVAPRITVPALVAACFLIVASHAVSRRPLPWPGWPLVCGFAVLVAWAAVSGVWEPGLVARPLAALSATVAIGVLVVTAVRWTDSRDTIVDALIVGLGFGLLIYAFEAISGGWLTRRVHGFEWSDVLDPASGGINVSAYLINGTAILSLLMWPAASALVDRRRTAWLVVIGLLVTTATMWFGSTAGVIGLAMGAIAWGAAAKFGARAARIAAVVFAIVVLTTPPVLNRMLPPPDAVADAAEALRLSDSAAVRLVVWRFAVDRIAERPLFGWGFDASRRVPGGTDSFLIQRSGGKLPVIDINLPLHPHNQALQIWLELGAVGAFIVAALGTMIIWRTGSLAPPFRAGALALVGNVVVYDYLSFGAWQNWWVAAVFIAATMLASGATDRDSTVLR